MADLYLLFFIVGVILFAAVVAYSLYQQRKPNADDDEFEISAASTELEAEPRVEPSLSVADDSATSDIVDEPTVLQSSASDDLERSVPRSSAAVDAVLTDSTSPSESIIESEDESASSESAGNKPVSNSQANTNRPYSSALDKAKSAVARIKQGAVSKAENASATKAAGINRAGVSEAGEKVPTQGGKIEPSLVQEAMVQETTVQEAVVQEATVEDELSTATPSTESKKTTVFSDDDSVVTDLVARVMNPKPIEQSDLLSLFREHDYKFSRKVHIYGLNELTDMWRDIEFELPSARFLELGISIQLCDREGAMSEKEGHDFQQMVLQFCERFDAPFEFSIGLDAALKQAQALDQVGRRYDSMAVLNVVPRSKSGFRVADIQSCARDLMMSTDKNGIFMKTEGQKNNITVLYRLACTDGEGHFGIRSMGQSTTASVYDLVVYMNVPATRDPEIVFQQMVKDANDLATWLDGKVVDRAGKAMTQRTYSTLMQQISDIAYSMQQDGLVPGDAVAKKLF